MLLLRLDHFDKTDAAEEEDNERDSHNRHREGIVGRRYDHRGYGDADDDIAPIFDQHRRAYNPQFAEAHHQHGKLENEPKRQHHLHKEHDVILRVLEQDSVGKVRKIKQEPMHGRRHDEECEAGAQNEQDDAKRCDQPHITSLGRRKRWEDEAVNFQKDKRRREHQPSDQAELETREERFEKVAEDDCADQASLIGRHVLADLIKSVRERLIKGFEDRNKSNIRDNSAHYRIAY